MGAESRAGSRTRCRRVSGYVSWLPPDGCLTCSRWGLLYSLPSLAYQVILSLLAYLLAGLPSTYSLHGRHCRSSPFGDARRLRPCTGPASNSTGFGKATCPLVLLVSLARLPLRESQQVS